MRAVFDRIVYYAEMNHKIILPPEKRQEIGRLVKAKWYEVMKGPLPKTQKNVMEPEGLVFCVVNYPEHFVPHIDEIIATAYSNLKRNRTRIPLNPIYSKPANPFEKKAG